MKTINKEQAKFIFAVWIGGIANYFKTLSEAKEEEKEWIKKGYTDIITQKINLKQ